MKIIFLSRACPGPLQAIRNFLVCAGRLPGNTRTDIPAYKLPLEQEIVNPIPDCETNGSQPVGRYSLYANEDQQEYLLLRWTERTVYRIFSIENLTVTADSSSITRLLTRYLLTMYGSNAGRPF